MAVMRASFEVGLLLRSQFRRYLKRKRFDGADIEWIEMKGWLYSEFLVRGGTKDLSLIRAFSDSLNQPA